MTRIEEKFLGKVNRFHTAFAFRGQEDASWKLHSSAVRRLIRDTDRIALNTPRFRRIYASYHRYELIEPARTAGFDIEEGRTIPDLQLLAKLQHFGAATGLMDFTWNPLVALWFACAAGEKDDEDGKVFVINLNDPMRWRRVPSGDEAQSTENIFLQHDDDVPLYWEPMARSEASARIIGQRSVFVIGRPLIPEDAVVEEIQIDSSDKKEIRKELADIFDVRERSLFRDVYGFSSVNRAVSPVRLMTDPDYYLMRGNSFYQQGDYSEAIESYGRCIELAGDVREPYLLRGNARSEIQDYAGALEDYDSAQKCTRLYLNWPPNTQIVHDPEMHTILFNRGNVKAASGDHRGAIADYNRALELDLNGYLAESIFFNRANTRTVLRRFEEAIEDYDQAIRIADSQGRNAENAYFNKGNVLVLCGRFSEALQCYNRSSRISNSGAGNKANAALLLERIGNARFTCHVDESATLGESLARVLVTVVDSTVKPEHFSPLFQGNVGNAGNCGGNGIPGGKGFPGKMGFYVELSWPPDDPTLETKMAKAEGIMGRYHNTLQILAK